MRKIGAFLSVLLAGCAELPATSNLMQQMMASGGRVNVVLSQDAQGQSIALATGGTPTSRTQALTQKISAKCSQQGLQAAGLTELHRDNTESPLGSSNQSPADTLRVRFTCIPYQ